jgi:hypothetical protein
MFKGSGRLGGELPVNSDGCGEALSLDLDANGKIEDNRTCWHDLPEAEDRAMAIEEIRGMIEREPFQPYFIKAKGGREHAIGHRANASISEARPSTVAIFVRGRGGTPLSLDSIEVVRLEPEVGPPWGDALRPVRPGRKPALTPGRPTSDWSSSASLILPPGLAPTSATSSATPTGPTGRPGRSGSRSPATCGISGPGTDLGVPSAGPSIARLARGDRPRHPCRVGVAS